MIEVTLPSEIKDLKESNLFNEEGYHATAGDLARIKKICKDRGVVYNRYKGTLERVVNGVHEVVYEFSK